MPALGQRFGHRHPEPPREVVVAGARDAQRLVAAPARPIPRRPLCGYRHDPLQHAADQRRREPKIAVPALLVDGEQTALGQLAEVPACGLRRYPTDIGEFRRGQRAAVEQNGQDIGAGRVADQRGNLGDRWLGSVHAANLRQPKRRFTR